jgi:hypothetical protein
MLESVVRLIEKAGIDEVGSLVGTGRWHRLPSPPSSVHGRGGIGVAFAELINGWPDVPDSRKVRIVVSETRIVKTK